MARTHEPKRPAIKIWPREYYPAGSAQSIRTHNYRTFFLKAIERRTPEVVVELACEILPLYRMEFCRDQEEREQLPALLDLDNYHDFHPLMAESWHAERKNDWWHRYETVRDPLRAWALKYQLSNPWMLKYALDALGQWVLDYASFEKCEQPVSEEEIQARAAKLRKVDRDAFCAEIRQRNQRIITGTITWPVGPITPFTFQPKQMEEFKYPSWSGYDEQLFEKSVRALFDEHLVAYMAKAREESSSLQRVETLTKPERFDMLTLYLCRRMSREQIAALPEFAKDPIGIHRDIRAAADLIDIPLRPRGRPQKKLQKSRAK